MSKLTSKKRNSLPASTFVEPGKRAYPIPDASHARNALARASGKPVEAKVKAAVAKKFPGIKQGSSGKYRQSDSGRMRVS
jgi:hypothetical protein